MRFETGRSVIGLYIALVKHSSSIGVGVTNKNANPDGKNTLRITRPCASGGIRHDRSFQQPDWRNGYRR